MEQQQPPFIVDGYPSQPQPDMASARCFAARKQIEGDRRSMPIRQGGEIVGMKRY